MYKMYFKENEFITRKKQSFMFKSSALSRTAIFLLRCYYILRFVFSLESDFTHNYA